jgi:hypothetical protein
MFDKITSHQKKVSLIGEAQSERLIIKDWVPREKIRWAIKPCHSKGKWHGKGFLFHENERIPFKVVGYFENGNDFAWHIVPTEVNQQKKFEDCIFRFGLRHERRV